MKRLWKIALAIVGAGISLAHLSTAQTSTPTPTPDPALLGQWARLQPWPFYPVNLILLSTGKVMFYSGDLGNSGNDTRQWDPATDTTTPLAQPGYNTFCTGTALRWDGLVLVIGGHIANSVGLPYASLYNPINNTWTRTDDMNAGRWYPTATALPNGDLLAISGYMTLETGINNVSQILHGTTWRNLTNALWGVAPYPWMFVTANGKVFCAGSQVRTSYLNTADAGAWNFVANSNWANRSYGSAVMYDAGKILILGGGGNVTEDATSPLYLPTETAETIDLNAAKPAWTFTQPMTYKRRHPNATLLPDGQVLVTGGDAGHGHNNQDRANAIHTGEIWNPATGLWTLTATSDPAFRRIYHSSAILLPDGRVLTAGGNYEITPEVYSPPYLFKGPRPTITLTPGDMDYNSTYFLKTPDAADITMVNWIRLGAATHAFDENQRINKLSFTKTAGGINFTTPTIPDLCPPGHYMLFILKTGGIPSVAKIVRIGVPFGPVNLTATALSKRLIQLKWVDKSSCEKGYKIERSVDGINFVQVAATLPNVVNYSDTAGLLANTPYTYRVQGWDAYGSSSYSAPATAKTLP